jgi:hypothetical protein
VRVLERMRRSSRGQFTDLAELGATEEQATDAVQWAQIDGTVRSGHEAIAAIRN